MEEIMQTGSLVYRSQNEDRALKAFPLDGQLCHIKYYEEYPLSSFDHLVCSILAKQDDLSIDYVQLGYMLGFDLVDDFAKDSLCDEAEVNFYKTIMGEVQEWGLIGNTNNIISLTELGKLALSKEKKYRFYEAAVNFLEFPNLLSYGGEKITLYPFRDELKIHNELTNKSKIPYSVECASFVTNEKSDKLVRDLQLQVDNRYVIFEAAFPDNPALSIVPTSLDVELYEQPDGTYTISFLCDGEYCNELNRYINHPINTQTKDRKVEWALYSKILHDENAVLKYEVLSPFEDIWDVSELIPDKRIVWQDERLLKLIIEYCDADEWHSLSKYCDVKVLEGVVAEYADYVDWNELTIRMDDNFLMDTHAKYPWVPKLLTERAHVSDALIKTFLLSYNFPEGKDDGEWDWEEVLPILGIEFISEHIADIPFGLSTLTKKLEEVNFYLIKEHPEAAWDWNYISTEYPTDYLLDNIDSFSKYLVLSRFLDRVFTDSNYSSIGAESESLRKSIENNVTTISNYYNVNGKAYCWSEKVIAFFEDLGLLTWEGGTYQKGFVYNQSLIWGYEFFSKYHSKITQEDSCNLVSSRLVDNRVIDAFPSFAWNWGALSRNKIVYDDVEFVKAHADKLDASTVLQNCSSSFVESYFQLLDANNLMVQDTYLRGRITYSVSVDFIRNNIHCNWDWAGVTRRVYDSINLNVIGNEIWRDKWDWDFLSDKISLDKILEYADKYADKWNWIVVLRRLNPEELTKDTIIQLLRVFANIEDSNEIWTYLSNNLPIETILLYLEDYSKCWNWASFLTRITTDILQRDGMLERIQSILEDNENAKHLWSIITGKYSTPLLNEVISSYSDEKYLWDYEELYSRPDFVVTKEYLEKNTDYINWDALSSSMSVNKFFETARSKKTRSLWLRMFKENLEESKFHWNYFLLSHLPNILEEPRLLQLNKAWDWEFISEHAKWIDTGKNEDYYFRKFIDKLSFGRLSSRTDINLSEDVVKKYDTKYKWDWLALTNNPSINFSLKYIGENAEKPWHWDVISSRKDLTMDFVMKHKEKEWDWLIVTGMPDFDPSVSFLKYLEKNGFPINWLSISENEKLKLEAIKEFQSHIIWDSLIANNPKFLEITDGLVGFVQEYGKYISWDVLNKRLGATITNNFIERFGEKIDWRNASSSQLINFSEGFVRKYEDKWYWNELFKNLKFRKDIPDYETIFGPKVNVVNFLNRFPQKPYIYHFTHIYNAIEVIRTRKILSRDRASELGLLRYDSAGSVVNRSNSAHPYARFYFRPCTPTQYYNEALGADSQLRKLGYGRPIIDECTGEKFFPKVWKSKYPQALNLGLPKCPIPVFFRFDVEEVLSCMPDLCYYSDRNMQSNAPHVYKIQDKPSFLCMEYLYDTMEDAKARAKSSMGYNASEIDKYKLYSQQEFLIKSEFDFSNLKSVQIVCYDREYTEILRTIFRNDPIVDRIVSCDEEYEYSKLFERENRSISLTRQLENYSLSCDFKDEYYYRVTGRDLNSIKFDFSLANMLKEGSTEYIVRGTIKWRTTDLPFEVYFVDPKARTKEWLIYSNLDDISDKPSKFILAEPIKNALMSFISEMEQLPIQVSKELFYPHMVYSYHGIAHTTRVLLATYLLCNTSDLSEQEKEACLIAAIIHDLGKRNDREGAEHGYNSMMLYKEKIKSLIKDESLQNRILNAVRYHSVEDKDCPEDVRRDVVWMVLKDADALDRSRFGGRGCDSSYLRLQIYNSPTGQNILDLATYLPGWTQDLNWDNPYRELLEKLYEFTE